MFCPKCGTQVPDGVKFCPTCGNLMQAQPQAPVQPQAPAQPQFQQDNFFSDPAPQPAYQQPAYQEPVYRDPVPPAAPAPTFNAYQEPAPQPVQQPAYNVYQEPAQPAYYNSDGVPDDGGASTPILILGILGLVFAFAPWMAGIIGIVLSAIAKGKAKNYKARFGGLFGKAKAGNGLAKAGLIVGIIFTIIWFIIIIVLLILMAISGEDFSDIINGIY